jgi:hypothetical protein
MASTYSDLKIELIGTGEQVGTWGSTTNANLGTAIEEAIVGSADVAFSSADVTLTLTNTNGTQAARHLRLNLTGTSGGARNLILGSGCQIDKPYIIANGLADTVTVKNTTGTGVAVPAGKSMWVYNNGTNVVEVITHTPVSSGGTGAYTLTANNVILGNGTSAVQFVAPGTSGNVLTSNGTTWASTAVPSVIDAGTRMIFAQTTAPTGWTKDTTNYNNHALRVVTGSASTGGSVDFTTAFTSSRTVTVTSISGSAGNTTLTIPQMPSHDHQYPGFSPAGSFGYGHTSYVPNMIPNKNPVTSTGGGGSHNHPFSFSSGSGTVDVAVKYLDVITATKN